MTELQRLYTTWADFNEFDSGVEVSSRVIPHLQLLSDVQESLFFEFVDFYSVDDGLLSILGYALSQRTSEVYWETYNSQMILYVEDAEPITPQQVFEIMRANDYAFLPEDTVWRLYVTDTDYVILNVMQLDKLWKEEHPVGKSVPLDSARITALNKWFRGSKKQRKAGVTV